MDKAKIAVQTKDTQAFQAACNIKRLFFPEVFTAEYIYQHIKGRPEANNRYVFEAIRIYFEVKDVTEQMIRDKAEEFRSELSKAAERRGARLVPKASTPRFPLQPEITITSDALIEYWPESHPN